MRVLILLTALLATAILPRPSAVAHDLGGELLYGQPTWHPSPWLGVSPNALAAAGATAWADRGIALGHWHDRPAWLRETPWHYHPWPGCAPPDCLPAYHRHLERVVADRRLPVADVLQRLAYHDYGGFTAVLLDGANYEIDAHNRYGRPVRLIVNAATGLLRAQAVLPDR